MLSSRFLGERYRAHVTFSSDGDVKVRAVSRGEDARQTFNRAYRKEGENRKGDGTRDGEQMRTIRSSRAGGRSCGSRRHTIECGRAYDARALLRPLATA